MDLQKLHKLVDNFHLHSILCVGDIMLDEYISGPVERLSPEAPVPVIRRTDVRQVLGGVGNVAANLAALGCETSVLYAVAQDPEAEQIKQMLDEKNVTAYPFTAGLLTTKKQRIIAQKQQICRLDSEEPLHLNKQQEDNIIHKVSSILPRINSILISDYNKGLITPRIVQEIIKMANEQHKYVLIDPKGSDYTKYKGATLIKPNLGEFKTAMKQIVPDRHDIDGLDPAEPQDLEEIKKLTEIMRKELNIQNVVVTLGEHGMLGSNAEGIIYRPTVAKSVSDVSGAGDTSLAVLGAALSGWTKLEDSLDLANIGAGIVVGKEGTATLFSKELKTTIRNMFNSESSNLWQQTQNLQRE